MKISVENLGTIKKGEISLDKDLTIFTGENNSGKSYMAYLCYGVLELLNNKKRLFPFADAFMLAAETKQAWLIK
jgi:predicted ATPase